MGRRIDVKMTTAAREVWKLRKANTYSSKLLKHSKWKPMEASEIYLNILITLKEKDKVFISLLSYIYFSDFSVEKNR